MKFLLQKFHQLDVSERIDESFFEEIRCLRYSGVKLRKAVSCQILFDFVLGKTGVFGCIAHRKSTNPSSELLPRILEYGKYENNGN